MGDLFPVLGADAKYADALQLFSKGHMAVLVLDGKDTIGIVTKTDLVDFMLAELG